MKCVFALFVVFFLHCSTDFANGYWYYPVEHIDYRCTTMPSVVKCRGKSQDSYYFDTIQDECKKIPDHKCVKYNPFSWVAIDFDTLQECQKACGSGNSQTTQKPTENPSEKPTEIPTETPTQAPAAATENKRFRHA